MSAPNNAENPFAAQSPSEWARMIETIGPARMLLVIESRLSERLRNKVSPDDIWQEVMLQAWRDRAAFEWRGLKSFTAWLLTLIDHRIRDAATHEFAQKRGGAAATVSLTVAGESDGMSSATMLLPPELIATTTPSRIAIYREQAAAMLAALASLPEELREVVRLRLFEQLTLEQIAERLGLTFAAVRHRFARGAEVYRRALRPHASAESGPKQQPPALRGSDSAS